jgi:hypothetical protein
MDYKTCKECPFYKSIDDKRGECHGDTPKVVVLDNTLKTVFPEVTVEDFCIKSMVAGRQLPIVQTTGTAGFNQYGDPIKNPTLIPKNFVNNLPGKINLQAGITAGKAP